MKLGLVPPSGAQHLLTAQVASKVSRPSLQTREALCRRQLIGIAGSGAIDHRSAASDDQFAAENGRRTFVLFELMVLTSLRRTGTARAIHDELLSGRSEQRVTLAVGQRIPVSDAPVMDIMWRPRRRGD